MKFDAKELERRIIAAYRADGHFDLPPNQPRLVRAICLALQEMQESQAAREQDIDDDAHNDAYDNYGSGD